MNENTMAFINAIRRFRAKYILGGESHADIAARWWRFRASETRKQRYLWLVVYSRP